mmetsp:Transcript_13448/g.52685  ORF Transcript_13448/g.52685 Transcript_13448/m.52685 type:complete len:279 (-) Transcript_13448:3264-4100(-)
MPSGYVLLFFEAAKFSKFAIGSDPALSTNTSGTPALLSSKQEGRSKGIGSTYLAPSSAPTKSVMAGTTLSGRNARMTIMRCSGVNASPHGSGSVSLCGSSESYSTFQRAGSLATSAGRSPLAATVGRSAILRISPQALSPSQSEAGFGTARSPVSMPPVRKNLSSSASMGLPVPNANSNSPGGVGAGSRRSSSSSSSSAPGSGESSPASSLALASASASALRLASRSAASASAFRYSASAAAFCASTSSQSTARSTFVAMRNANKSLSCSKSERQTIW